MELVVKGSVVEYTACGVEIASQFWDYWSGDFPISCSHLVATLGLTFPSVDRVWASLPNGEARFDSEKIWPGELQQVLSSSGAGGVLVAVSKLNPSSPWKSSRVRTCEVKPAHLISRCSGPPIVVQTADEGVRVPHLLSESRALRLAQSTSVIDGGWLAFSWNKSRFGIREEQALLPSDVVSLIDAVERWRGESTLFLSPWAGLSALVGELFQGEDFGAWFGGSYELAVLNRLASGKNFSVIWVHSSLDVRICQAIAA